MTFRSSSSLSGVTGSTAVVPVPSGATSGDIAVVGIYKENTANITTVPSGFTLKATLNTSATQRGSLYVYWKRLTGADTGNYTFSWSGGAWRAAVCGLWSGRVATGDPFDGTVGTAESTGSVATLNVSTSPANANGDAVGIWTNFSGANAGNWSPPASYAERADIDVMTLDTQDAIASGSTGNVTANATGQADFMKAFLGVLQVAGGGGGTVALGQAVETDTATQAARSKSRTLAQPSEVDTATLVTRAKSRLLQRASEISTATVLSRAKSLGLTEAVEFDTATVVGRAKSATLGQSIEIDTAQQLTIQGQNLFVLGQAVELDTGRPVARVKNRQLAQAVELDTAATVGRAKRLAVSLATEVDAATSVTVGDPEGFVLQDFSGSATPVTHGGTCTQIAHGGDEPSVIGYGGQQSQVSYGGSAVIGGRS